MNLTDCETFTVALIKRAESRFNNVFLRDIKRCIREIVTNNGWNTQVVQILREIRDGKFIFKHNILSRIPKPVELSH